MSEIKKLPAEEEKNLITALHCLQNDIGLEMKDIAFIRSQLNTAEAVNRYIYWLGTKIYVARYIVSKKEALDAAARINKGITELP